VAPQPTQKTTKRDRKQTKTKGKKNRTDGRHLNLETRESKNCLALRTNGPAGGRKPDRKDGDGGEKDQRSRVRKKTGSTIFNEWTFQWESLKDGVLKKNESDGK